MKDSESLILKAFLAALCQQRSPLPDKVQAKLGEITQSLETKVMDLHNLAISTPSLKNLYKNSRLWLTSTTAEQTKGLKFLPADNHEDEDNEEIANVIRDTRSSVEQMKQVLAAPDSVQAARKLFNYWKRWEEQE
ncbi:MAG: hypothetical protein F6K41_29525 [Symploca sp. SIO3E6]|nr:hypothetical protein [Caldora sp. SIO3E6]